MHGEEESEARLHWVYRVQQYRRPTDIDYSDAKWSRTNEILSGTTICPFYMFAMSTFVGVKNLKLE